MLKIIRDHDYGFSVNQTIGINVQRIWGEKRRFDSFAKEFASTYSHEVLHLLLGPIKRKRILGEEKVIRRLLNEQWDDSVEKMYAKG